MFLAHIKVKDVDEVWANWEKIKKDRESRARGMRGIPRLDGVPKHLPALLRAEKLVKKARKAQLLPDGKKTGRATWARRRWPGNCSSWPSSPKRAAGARRNC